MERRNRLMLFIMAMLLIVVSGSNIYTVALKSEVITLSNGAVAYNNSSVVNSTSGEFDLSNEDSDVITIESVNKNAGEQTCEYSIEYTSESFKDEFIILINNEEILVNSANLVIYSGSYVVEQNETVENIFTVSSSENNGLVKVSNVTCSVVE